MRNAFKPIQIVGRACRLPGAANVQDFWTLLTEGRCAVSQINNDHFSSFRYMHDKPGQPGKAYTFSAGVLENVWEFDPAVFGISPREAVQMDPQQRLLLTLVWEALEEAGMPPSDVAGQQIGVYVGNSSSDHSTRFFMDPFNSDSFMMTGNTGSLVSNRISYIYDLHGPSFTVDTACSSSLVALDQAVKALQAGEIDTAIVAGVNLLLSPFPFVGFSAAAMLSPDGLCKPFAESANGYVRAEGGVVLILQNDAAFQKDQQTSYGQIIATGVNSDGRTSGVALPSTIYQAQLLEALYRDAGIDANDLAFIEAHGTGTRVGDPAEANALGTVLGSKRDKPLPIGSVKSNIGHLEPASGLASILKASLALEYGELPASLHVSKPNPDIPFNELNLALNVERTSLANRDRVQYAGVNNFGFGGTNAHTILASPLQPGKEQGGHVEAIEKSPIEVPLTAETCLLLSANHETSLHTLAQDMITALEQDDQSNVADWAASLAWHRQWHAERLAICGTDKEDLLKRLRAYVAQEQVRGCIAGQALQSDQMPILVFSGNGSQWAGMGQQALTQSPVFARHFRRVDDLFQPLSGWSLEAMLLAEDLDDQLKHTSIAQPLLFAIQVALSQAIKDFNIPIGGVLGHSVGEVAGAWAAGALSLDQAVKVIYARSHHQEATRGVGRMAVVKVGAETARDVIAQKGFEGIEVSAINTASSITISGPSEALDAFLKYAKSQRWPSKALDIDYPFHSRAIDPIKDGLLADLAHLQPVEQSHPFYSSVSGKIEQGINLNANYWWENIRQPVQFHQAVDAALLDGHRLFVEIGPRSILKGYLSEIAREAGATITCLASLDQNQSSDCDPVHAIIALLLINGARFDKQALFGPRTKLSLPLPSYPWAMKDYRVKGSDEAIETIVVSQPAHPLLGYKTRNIDWIWDNDLSASSLPYLQDHKVDGKVILPGAAFAEMALEAGRQWLGTDKIELRDMDLVQALTLSEDHMHTVRTCIDFDAQVVEIMSRQRNNQEEWQIHAKCRIAAIPGEVACETLLDGYTAPDLNARSAQGEIDHLYAIAKSYGLDFGPSFRRMCHLQELDDNQLEIILTERALPNSPRERIATGYGLHPLDLDGTFHALNALYDRLASGAEKLAYIPVRFGAIRLYDYGTMVRSARLTILRGNSRNISVDIDLFGPQGELVATVKDGRFRASALVQRLNLERTSYSITTQSRSLSGDALMQAIDIFDDLDLSIPGPVGARSAIDEGHILVQTATRRAAYDCLLTLCDEHNQLDLTALPPIIRDLSDTEELDRAREDQQTQVRELERHRALLISSLALICEDSGLAELKDNKWHLAQECPLPDLSDMIQLIQTEDPRWVAHMVLLGRAAQIYPQILLNMDLTGETDQLSSLFSKALMDQYSSASPLASAFQKQSLDQIERALTAWPEGKPLRVLELGAGAGRLTRQLLPLVKRFGGHLVCADSSKTVLERLSIQFASEPAFESLHLASNEQSLLQQEPFDLVISADHWASQEQAGDHVAQLRSCMRPGGLLMLVFGENSIFHDFVFGLDVNWFQASLDVGLPVGRIGSAKGWLAHIQDLGFEDCALNAFCDDTGEDDLSGAYCLSARQAEIPQNESLGQEAEEQQDDEIVPSAPLVLLTNGTLETEKDFCQQLQTRPNWPRNSSILADWDAEQTDQLQALLEEHMASLPKGQKINLLYLSGCFGWQGNGHQDDLSFAAARLSNLRDLLSVLSGYPVRLTLLAIGGAPVDQAGSAPSALNHGLWAFGRTAMNEYGELDIRLVDLDQTVASDRIQDQLLCWLHNPGDEGELILGEQGMTVLRVSRGFEQSAISHHKAWQGTTIDQTSREMVKLTLPQTGSLERMGWQKQSLPELGPQDIQIEVAATGLNFRDVMWAQGLLPEEALEDGFAGATLGFECTGRISAIGVDVKGFEIGDAVMALAPDCFASHVTVGQFGVSKLPAGIDLTAAASIPVAFLTAYYALHGLAQLEEDEWVLIHGAAGAVGLAAVQIAKWKGARIIATAGSEEKREFLKHLGADHVLNTRSLDFVDQVRLITERERGSKQIGVDVVLNSLFGEAMERSLELVRPFGRFLELGKRDFYGNTKIGLRPFRKNISYFGIDADQLLSQQPKKAQRLFAELSDLFAQGEFNLLPYRLFEPSEILDAFRLMQQSGHIGKIIVRAPDLTLARQVATEEVFEASADGHHIIIGGLGGFGLEAASWLADNGARSLVLVGRSGRINDQAQTILDRLKRRHIAVEIAQCDVTDSVEVTAMLDRLRQSKPIKGVIHSAMVLEDAFIQNLTDDQIQQVLAPKIKGGAVLDMATEQDELDYFVLFSSISVLLGNPGQAHYVTANAYLDGLARQRHARGKSALSVGWGAISDVGILARESGTADLLAKQTGGIDFKAQEALRLLGQYLVRQRMQATSPVVSIAPMNWSFAKDNLPIMSQPAYALLSREAASSSGQDQQAIDVRALIEGLSISEASETVARLLAEEVAAIFRMPVEDINLKRPLSDIGMDSLMGMELRTAAQQRLNLEIPMSAIGDGTSLLDLATSLAERISEGPQEEQGQTDRAEPPLNSTHEMLLQQHMVEEESAQ